MKIINISVERAQNGIFHVTITFVKFDHKFLRKIIQKWSKLRNKENTVFTLWFCGTSKNTVVCTLLVRFVIYSCSAMPSVLSKFQRVELIQYYDESKSVQGALRKFRNVHNLRSGPCSEGALRKLVKKFEGTGSVLDAKWSGRRPLSEIAVAEVLNTWNEFASEIPWALVMQVSNIMACKITWSEPPWLLALRLFGVESLCTQPFSVEDMKSVIQEEIFAISTKQLTDAVSCFAKRVGAVIESKGLHFEHLP